MPSPVATRARSGAVEPASPTPTPPPVAVAVGPRSSFPPNARAERATPIPPRPLDPEAPQPARAPFLALAALIAILLVLAPRFRSASAHPLDASLRLLGDRVHAAFVPALAAASMRPVEAPALPAPLPAGPRADAGVKHDGYAPIPGGVLFAPRSFHSEDGAYDLFLHFHGNTRVVEESAERADLNAMVAVVNLGVGSGPYQDAYAVPGTYEALLDSIEGAVAERGLSHPHLRRVALSSWSAGYGAIGTILELRKGADPLDAVLVLDGIHCGLLGDAPRRINPQNLGAWVALSKRAAAGELLFSLTHSEIVPVTYASSTETADYLLEMAGAARGAPGPSPEHVALESAEGAVAKKLEKFMEPTSEARLGDLHVRGYRGNTPEHHMAHLLQMAATVVPELAARWREPAAD